MNLQDTLEALATCLCAQIQTDGSPTPCFCGVVPGDGVALSYMGNCDDRDGIAWVRLNTIYPASGVGSQNTRPGNCGSEIGADIELGIMRTYPIGANGEPPDEPELLAISHQQTIDALTMIRAVSCCSAIRKNDTILGAYTPAGPLGGAVGGAFLINIVV